MKLWEDGENITADLAIELATAFARRLYQEKLSPKLTQDAASQFARHLCESVMRWDPKFDIGSMFRLAAVLPQELALTVGETYVRRLREDSRAMPDDLTLDMAVAFIEGLFDSELPCEVTMKIGSVFMMEMEEAEMGVEQQTLDLYVLFDNYFIFWW